VSTLEDQCESETDQLMQGMGTKAPACLEHIGTSISLLDRMASCWWGCKGEEHTIEYLCGRASSNGRAALRLLRFGLYDESLLMARAIGESANLLQLFVFDPTELHKWKRSTRKERLEQYRPTAVRVKIEKTAAERPRVSRERYEALSSRAAHFQPSTIPQAHNILGVPMLNGIRQDAGIVVCLNEIALSVGLVAGFGSTMLGLAQETTQEILNHAKRLDDVLGRATITGIDDYFQQMKDNPETLRGLDEVARQLREWQRARLGPEQQ